MEFIRRVINSVNKPMDRQGHGESSEVNSSSITGDRQHGGGSDVRKSETMRQKRVSLVTALLGIMVVSQHKSRANL